MSAMTDVVISREQAHRLAVRYIILHLGDALRPGHAELLAGGKHAVWHVEVEISISDQKQGTLHIAAETGNVLRWMPIYDDQEKRR
jgi:hypothetical protein